MPIQMDQFLPMNYRRIDISDRSFLVLGS
eukprot:COSAG06_NODE_48267_length_333_cov_0.880342_1_plen_28_part_01